jgi:hypothetical protein
VLLKAKNAYCFWLCIYKNFPKIERFGLGQKIDTLFLETLELVSSATYLAPENKIVLLTKAIGKIDLVKFFIQLAWEDKLVATEKYSELLLNLEEIGRMLGGWKRGLQTKTPAK